MIADLEKVAPPLGSPLAAMSHHERKLALWKSYGGPPLDFPWPGPIADIYYGWMGLGRDMSAITLHSERESWLRSNGWLDQGEVEAGLYFFQVLEGEMSEVREILHPTPKQGR